jgi:hypothetical protein
MSGALAGSKRDALRATSQGLTGVQPVVQAVVLTGVQPVVQAVVQAVV